MSRHPTMTVLPSEFAAARLRRSEQRFALTVVALFAAGGLAWVFLTDAALYAVTHDRALVARFETAKGWAFVLLAACLLYPALRRSARRLTHAQATLLAVIESIGDGVLLLGRDRAIVHANPAAARMLRTDAAALAGVGREEFSRTFRVSSTDGALVPPEELVSQRVFDEAGPLHRKVVLHPPGGAALTVFVTAAAVRMDDGEPAASVVSVLHDVTEAERLDEARDQFFAEAAHCLKTPVTVIQASAQWLSRTGLEGSPLLGTIERHSMRIDRLVDNLLLLARLRSGTLRLHPERVELGPILDALTQGMARASAHHRLGTEFEASVAVHADPERIAIAVRNLVDGALQASERDSLVLVRLARHGADAVIGVHFLPALDGLAAGAALPHDELGVSHFVTCAVVKAHGGRLFEERVAGETRTGFRMPAAAMDAVAEG